MCCRPHETDIHDETWEEQRHPVELNRSQFLESVSFQYPSNPLIKYAHMNVSVEINTGIVAACISFLKPMIQKLQENTARSISTTKTDTLSLRPFSSFSSGVRASRYFSSQTRTEISAQRRSLADYIDAENGFLESPNEITRTTVVTVDSFARDRAKSVAGSQNDVPQQAEEDKL